MRYGSKEDRRAKERDIDEGISLSLPLSSVCMTLHGCQAIAQPHPVYLIFHPIKTSNSTSPDIRRSLPF